MCPECESAYLTWIWSSKSTSENCLVEGCSACGYEVPGTAVTDPDEIREILDHVNEM